MKKLFILSYFVFLISYSLFAQSVGIGTNAPNASAQLDVTATNKGILVPRVTNAQMLAIASPANGLLVYNTDSSAFAYRNATAWVFLKGNGTASNNWNTLGNAGTNAAANFIGTTDNVDVVFKRNNQRAGLLAFSNTGFGNQALNPASTGVNNTAVGYRALFRNSTGNNNTAFGFTALPENTTGERNTAMGTGALNSSGISSTADNNTAVGSAALQSNEVGYSNVAVGVAALQNNTSRSNLVAIGDSALFNNGTGVVNEFNATANTAVGSKALYSNNTGNQNTAVGFESMKNNTTGIWNTAMGWYSMGSSTGGTANAAFGYRVLNINNGSYNAAVGSDVLASNETGSYNTAVGHGAMAGVSNGSNNTAVGYWAGLSNEGSSNVFLGYKAGQNEAGSNKLYISNDETNAANTLVYGEFDNKILSVDGNLGIGTTTPENLLHLKNASTDANASQVIVESNSGFGNSTVSAIEFRSNFSSSNSGPSGRIKSYYTSNNYTDAKTTFQTVAPGPAFVDAMTLTNGRVGIGTTTPHGDLHLPQTLANRKIVLLEDFDNDHQFNGFGINTFIMRYQAAATTSSHVFYVGTGANTSSELMRITGNGEVGIGKVPFTTNDDSRLQIKQKGFQNGIGVEASNSTNHWDWYVDGGVFNFNLYYNGSLKGSFDNVTGAYTANSDRRLKKDITPQQPVLNNVMQLQAYKYHYLDNKTTDRYSNGFMAQDVQKLFPDAVVENTMKDGEKRLGINYQYFTVLAIKGLQEQQKDIEQMKAQMKLMMEEIEKLKALVKAVDC
jgi:trimeric autotransporter adhesin